jgi:rhodanese-related sulfurtransferase
VPDAKLIPVNSVYARREELPKDKDIIMVCQVGSGAPRLGDGGGG